MSHRLTLLMLLFTSAAHAQGAPAIDAVHSKITVRAYKSGLFAFAAHDHVISAPITSGRLNAQDGTVEFSIQTADMQVMDPEASERERVEIRKTMLGDKLLDSDHFPLITFRSTSVSRNDASSWRVRGLLALHGSSKEISLIVKQQGTAYIGSTKLRQSDYGLTPISVAGGTVKVKDEVAIEFEVIAQ